MIAEGEDRPETIKLKQLAERPAERWLYRLSMESSQAISFAAQVDVEDLEDWLWMQNKWSKYSAPNADDPSYLPGTDPWLGIRQVLAEGREHESSESWDSLSTNAIHQALIRSLGMGKE